MNRPYTAHSPYSLTPTERLRSPRGRGRYDGGNDREDRYGDLDTDVYPPYPDDDGSDDYVDYDEYLDEARIDRRWMWIAGVAGVVLFVAVITASAILGGGDSGSVSATVASDEPSASAAPQPS
ncbi:hypothetical protein H7H73_28355, partial [Mycobacterium rufum]|nr:hypothetical protein [Mycolicibacterium rufum]